MDNDDHYQALRDATVTTGWDMISVVHILMAYIIAQGEYDDFASALDVAVEVEKAMGTEPKASIQL